VRISALNHPGFTPPLQPTPAAQAAGAVRAAEKNSDPRLKKAVQEFEALFLTQMLQEMRKTVPEGGLFEHSGQDRMYESMMDEQLGYQLAQGRGMGLSQALYRQLLRSADAVPAVKVDQAAQPDQAAQIREV